MRRAALSLLLVIFLFGFGYAYEAGAAANGAVYSNQSTQKVLRFYIDKTDYYINDQLQVMDTVPIIKDDRTLLPIRYVAAPLGASVEWNEGEQKVTAILGIKKIELWIGQATAKVNGVAVPIDPNNSNVTAIVVPPGRTMLPLRFITENLGCRLAWEPLSQMITVTSPADNAVVNPDDFVAKVNNPLWPLVPGTIYIYQAGEEKIEVTVTDETREILGVTATVVHDVVIEDGEVTEDTYDWYAQDVKGNVWYFGEDTKEYDEGKLVSTKGSWEAGVDGAKPGIVIHAVQPAIGTPYQQEYYAGQAEDMAEVVSLSESVTVPYGSFDNCLKTREFTPLEPNANEYKYYAPGVGMVLEVDITSGDREELLDVRKP
jgi:hypothetical protein